MIAVSFGCVSFAATLYVRQNRLLLNSASTVIEGHSIDSLNIANLRRRVNRTFVIQEASHTVRIKGEDLHVTWKYSGFCRIEGVASMEFSIDSDEATPFDQLDCVAFDLGQDPELRHKIRPMLASVEGISKKISVPLLAALKANEAFSVQLSFTLPGCVKAGFGYYTSTSSFAQARVQRSVVHLIFLGASPRWMRVYESSARRPNKLVKTLPAARQEPGSCEYIDVVEGRHGRSARVYAFWRDSL